MSFSDSTILSSIFNNNDIKLNVNQNTIDLLNAALASHTQNNTQQQLVANLQQDNNNNNKDNKEAHGTAKRTIDSTDESDATVTTPKRPGRKPLDKTLTSTELALDPKQKRKAQNRAAQRAFRERKEKHVSELQERIKELEELASKNDEDLIRENQKLKEQLKLLQEENYALKDAKFTFEFPISNGNNNNNDLSTSSSLSSPTTTTNHTSSPSTMTTSTRHNSSSSSSVTSPLSNNNNDQQDDLSGNSSSCTEQSPLSMGQEEDSDAPATKTPSFQDDPSTFLSFGTIPPSQDFDFLAVPRGNGDGDKGFQHDSTFDIKKLFQGKDDLFTGYRAPPSTMDDFAADDFLLDGGGLPALFGSDDTNLFGFSTTPTTATTSTPSMTATDSLTSPIQHQSPSNNNNTSFNLDQFYLPTEGQVKKEALEQTLYQAKENGIRAYEVQQQLKQIPDFNLDVLCDDLKKKASCCESSYVLTQHDVESYLKCFDQI
ncbi:unnamed protein product [Cunninghamella echinulata]